MNRWPPMNTPKWQISIALILIAIDYLDGNQWQPTLLQNHQFWWWATRRSNLWPDLSLWLSDAQPPVQSNLMANSHQSHCMPQDKTAMSRVMNLSWPIVTYTPFCRTWTFSCHTATLEPGHAEHLSAATQDTAQELHSIPSQHQGTSHRNA